MEKYIKFEYFILLFLFLGVLYLFHNLMDWISNKLFSRRKKKWHLVDEGLGRDSGTNDAVAKVSPGYGESKGIIFNEEV